LNGLSFCQRHLEFSRSEFATENPTVSRESLQDFFHIERRRSPQVVTPNQALSTMESLILQAEQLENDAVPLTQGATEIYPEIDEQTQRVLDVAEIMARIGYVGSSEMKKENLQLLPKKRKDIIMSREDWDEASRLAIDCLRLNTKTEIHIHHFALELETRCTVKNNGIRHFMIFPWFHMKNIRFRQSLKRDGRLGPTIEKVIEAINYFLRKNGKDYTEEEIQFLQDYYKKMEIPEPSRCLTTIVEVYSEFRKHQDEIYSESCLSFDSFRATLSPFFPPLLVHRNQLSRRGGETSARAKSND
jgi:hypothetical protein